MILFVNEELVIHSSIKNQDGSYSIIARFPTRSKKPNKTITLKGIGVYNFISTQLVLPLANDKIKLACYVSGEFNINDNIYSVQCEKIELHEDIKPLFKTKFVS